MPIITVSQHESLSISRLGIWEFFKSLNSDFLGNFFVILFFGGGEEIIRG